MEKPSRGCSIKVLDILNFLLYILTLVVTYFLSRAANDITHSANQISKASLLPFLHFESTAFAVDQVHLAIKNSGAGPAVVTEFGFAPMEGDSRQTLLRLPDKPGADAKAEGKKKGRKQKAGEAEEDEGVELTALEDPQCLTREIDRPANVIIEIEEDLTAGNYVATNSRRVIGTGDAIVLVDIKLTKVATEQRVTRVRNDIFDIDAGTREELVQESSFAHVLEWRNYAECIRSQLDGIKVWVKYQNALGEDAGTAESVLRFPTLQPDADPDFPNAVGIYGGLLES